MEEVVLARIRRKAEALQRANPQVEVIESSESYSDAGDDEDDGADDNDNDNDNGDQGRS